MKGYIEERAVEIANYIIENNATVRQTAKQFGISKSTVHVEVTKQNGLEVRLCGQLNKLNKFEQVVAYGIDKTAYWIYNE